MRAERLLSFVLFLSVPVSVAVCVLCGPVGCATRRGVQLGSEVADADFLPREGAYVSVGPIWEGRAVGGGAAPAVAHNVSLEEGECYAITALAKNGKQAALLVSIEGPGGEKRESVFATAAGASLFCPDKGGAHKIVVTSKRRPVNYACRVWRRTVGALESGALAVPHRLPLNRLVSTEGGRPVDKEALRKAEDAAVFSIVTRRAGQLVVNLHNVENMTFSLNKDCDNRSVMSDSDVLTSRRKNSTVLTVPQMTPGTYCLLAWSLGGDAPRRFGVHVRTLPPVKKERRCEDAALLTLGKELDRGVRAAFRIADHTQGGFFSYRSETRETHTIQDTRRLKFTHPQRLAVMTSIDGFVTVCLENGCGPEAEIIACKSISGRDPLYTTVPAGTTVLYVSPEDRYLQRGVEIGLDAAPTDASLREPVEGDTATAAIDLGSDRGEHRLFVDTLIADDTTAHSTGGAGAPDLFYSFAVQSPGHVEAAVTVSTFNATVCLARKTDAGPDYIRCIDYGPGKDAPEKLDEALTPGEYFIVVDGKAAADFGRAMMRVAFRAEP